MQKDTIFALATPQGRSGVAIIRMSGVRALNALKLLTNMDEVQPRHAYLKPLYDKSPDGRDLIDHALILYFNAPHSFTGEDVVELHPHGSPAVLRYLLDVLSNMDGLRMAEPGEFTRRAFENGKMDLTGAEAVADLIHAETQLQRAQALSQMGGALSSLYEGWTDSLKRSLAYLEADLEFPDEDLPDGILPDLLPAIKQVAADMQAHLNDNRRGERLRDGVHIAVVGAPNAGKSSLVNQLAQRDVAIVSDVAGTTRDVIEVHLDLGGYPVIIADTAGLRPEQLRNSQKDHDRLEQEGIKRALQRAQAADLKMVVFDGQESDINPDSLALCDENALVIVNKAEESTRLVLPDTVRDRAVLVSANTGHGIDALLKAISHKLDQVVGRSEAPSLTRQRHRDALQDAAAHLDKVCQGAPLPELAAEDLRLAVRAIGRITGKVDVEDLLDVIFRDFCIGK